MSARRTAALLAMVGALLARPGVAEARKGFYLDFYAGVETHMDPDTVVVDIPEFAAESHATSLFELDFGYTFKAGLSLGLGFELVNWVAPNVKTDIKYSFLRSGPLQPYVYLCLHGGIVHLYPLAVHLGWGVDYFVTRRVYLALDLRGGWEAVRNNPFEQHLEAAVTLGFGFMLTGSGY